MSFPQGRYGQLLNTLRLKNYRMTPQRMELLRLIISSDEHPSAAQLYQQIKIDFPTMSYSTVYKTLDLLKELSEVFEIGLREDNHYDGKRPAPHPHLICTNCQKIMDGETGSSISDLIAELERASGYRILRHQLIFYGLCPNCQKKLMVSSVVTKPDQYP